MRFHLDLLRYCSSIGVVLLVITTSAVAQVTLFSDDFGRTTQPNDDIDADSTGMGGALSPLVYVENGDTIAAVAGLTNIEGDALHLADGPNASSLYVDHNFIDSDITTQGGFSVSLELVSNDGSPTDIERFVGFGVGATAAEFTGQTQLDFGATAANPALRGRVGEVDSGFADLWVGYSPNSNGTIQVFKNGANVATYDNGGSGFGPLSGQTLEVQYAVSDFNQGSQVDAFIYFDGQSVAQEVFNWDNASSNFIGINARQGQMGFTVDNLSVTALAVEPPPVPVLTINRDTGNVELENLSSSPITLVGYTIQTNGGFDTSVWNTLNDLDSNDTWELLTEDDPDGSGVPENPATDLSEATLGTGYTVDASGGPADTIDFGNTWIKSPFENLVVEFRDDLGAIVPVNVSFEGNDGNPFQLGDFDFMNGVDAADWAILRSNLISDPVEEGLLAYDMGDINADGLINEADFDEFKVAFDSANGPGAFQAMITGVPEPTSICLVALGGLFVALRRGRSAIGFLLVMLVCTSASNVSAQTNLFSDSFARSIAQEDDIDATSTGMTGTLAPLTLIENGDATMAPDAQPSPAGLTNIENDLLHLADGDNASSFYLDHNFVDSAIASDGVLSVSLDLVSNGGANTSNNHFIGFGIGATLAEHQAQTELDFDATDTPAVRGNINTPGSGFADLWIGWSPTDGGTIQIIKNGELFQSIDDGIANATDAVNGWIQPGTVDGVGSTLELRIAVDSFGAGDPVAATVYFNGVAVGGDAFRWDNSNANYIGVTARQSDEGYTASNLAITTSTDALEVQTLSVEVYTDTGEAFLVGGAGDITIDRYTISSAGGLESGNFNGIGGDAGLPAGDGSGNGWELGGQQSDSLLNEFYLGADGQGSSTLGSAFRASLGTIYDTSADTRDLIVEYHLSNGSTISGAATYRLAPNGLPGDFNGDEIVNLADYTVWRDNLGGTFDLNGNGNESGGSAGVVDAADYDLWKASFGNTASGSLSALRAAVPEPTSVLLLLGISIPLVALRRQAIRVR